MSHKYGVGARIVVKETNKEAKVTDLLPPEGDDVPRYRVKTDLGSAVWRQDWLK